MDFSDKIQEYYLNNKDKLYNLYKENEKSIDGRICHPSILILYILLQFIDIKKYMEIGVHNGGSISMILSTKKKCEIYGLDLFEDIYNKNKHLNITKYNKYQYFTRDKISIKKTINNLNIIKKKYNNNSNINLIKGNSYFNETENEIKKYIKKESLDLLFIDGDHTMDGVKNDFERYSKYVKKGGYIIFDDYHHQIIKKYVDNLLLLNKNLKLIIKFKCNNTSAIDILIQKNN